MAAERIAHGVSSVEDPDLILALAKRGIALDVCPTSNICQGVYPTLAQHPLRRMHETGVVITVTVNSDDPAVQYDAGSVSLLAGPFELGVSEIDEILLSAVRQSFLPAPEKQRFEASHRAELESLKPLHLGASSGAEFGG